MQIGRGCKPSKPGQHSVNELVTGHLWLVRAIARKMLGKLPRHLELSDLIEEGVLGVIAAARRYDVALEYRFRRTPNTASMAPSWTA